MMPTGNDSKVRRNLPALVFLSGARRGTSLVFQAERAGIAVSPSSDVELLADGVPSDHPVLAKLERRGDTYELETTDGAEIWVNGEPIERMVLASGDVIELGKTGIVIRFRLYPAERGPYKTMAEAFSDCVDCARYGGESVLERAGILVTGVPRELATQTTSAARLGLLLIAALLIGSTGALWFRNVGLEQRLADEVARVEGLEDLLGRAESNSFTKEDFEAARAELKDMVSETATRIDSLEALAGARERVIAESSKAVVFLQGAYGFVELDSDRPLRYVAGPDGRPLRTPNGRTPVTLEGNGAIVEILYTGTAFVATAEGHLLTNRHVALPWEFDQSAQATIRRGFRPVMRRMVGYLPGVDTPFTVALIGASDTADVALLRREAPTSTLAPLELARDLPQRGDEVVVLGYPAGMRALMAQAGVSFAQNLVGQGSLDFWQLAEGLSRGGYISPLATQGIVGQVTSASLVYDAQTTHGGSGGPVLGLDGKVVAVNAAIVPEFGGSNLGVPAAEALRLLASAEEE